MRRVLTLSEVKAIYGEACFETETAFGVNDFGKYRPGMTFIIGKTFDVYPYGGDMVPKGHQMWLNNVHEFQYVRPTAFVADEEITDNMNVRWGGEAKLLFGDFWRSKKGGACFRPKNPLHAKHLLLDVKWGGAFNRSRGASKSYAEEVGAIYFRSASSNGGGEGHDYWVLPVGFVHVIKDEEIDGDAAMVTESDRARQREERAMEYRQRHANLARREIEEANAFQEEKDAARAASIKAKARLLPKVESLKARLDALREVGGYDIDTFDIRADHFEMGHTEYLFADGNVRKAEERVAHLEGWVAEGEARKELRSWYELYSDRVVALGLKLEFHERRLAMDVKEPQSPLWSETVRSFDLTEEALADFLKYLEKREEEGTSS